MVKFQKAKKAKKTKRNAYKSGLRSTAAKDSHIYYYYYMIYIAPISRIESEAHGVETLDGELVMGSL